MVSVDHEYHCNKCGENKPGDEFRWVIRNGKKCKKHCLLCTSRLRTKWHEDNHARASDAHRALCQRKSLLIGEPVVSWWFSRHIHQWRNASIRKQLPVPDLDVQHVLELYRLQDGRCYYSGDILEWSAYGSKHAIRKPLLVSMDRKTPSLGYVKGNVVLCSLIMNMMKGDRTTEEFYEQCRRVLRKADATSSLETSTDVSMSSTNS